MVHRSQSGGYIARPRSTKLPIECVRGATEVLGCAVGRHGSCGDAKPYAGRLREGSVLPDYFMLISELA